MRCDENDEHLAQVLPVPKPADGKLTLHPSGLPKASVSINKRVALLITNASVQVNHRSAWPHRSLLNQTVPENEPDSPLTPGRKYVKRRYEAVIDHRSLENPRSGHRAINSKADAHAKALLNGCRGVCLCHLSLIDQAAHLVCLDGNG